MARPKMAKIQGEGRRNGFTPEDIPDGWISWEEHYMAWQTWAHSRREPVPAEQIDREGGFGYRQVASLLGHNPVSWEAQEQKYSLFEFGPEDAPTDLTAFKFNAPPPKRSHVRDGTTEMPICELDDDAPDGMFFFDHAEGAHCEKCFSKMQTWLNFWVELSKKEPHG